MDRPNVAEASAALASPPPPPRSYHLFNKCIDSVCDDHDEYPEPLPPHGQTVCCERPLGMCRAVRVLPYLCPCQLRLGVLDRVNERIRFSADAYRPAPQRPCEWHSAH